MFGSGMKNMIGRKRNCAHVVTPKNMRILNSLRNDYFHINSEVALAKLLYSASVDDLDTTYHFLED